MSKRELLHILRAVPAGPGRLGGSMLNKIGTKVASSSIAFDTRSSENLLFSWIKRRSISSSVVEFINGFRPEPTIPAHPVNFKILRASFALVRFNILARSSSVSLEAVLFSSRPKFSVSHFAWVTVSWVACGVQHWLIAKRACDGGER